MSQLRTFGNPHRSCPDAENGGSNAAGAGATAPARRGGLFDFQVNGFGGIDFQQDALSGADLKAAVAALRRHGVDRIFLTLITDEIDRLCRRLENIERICASHADIAAVIAGYHVEGPWLSPEPGFCGA